MEWNELLMAVIGQRGEQRQPVRCKPVADAGDPGRVGQIEECGSRDQAAVVGPRRRIIGQVCDACFQRSPGYLLVPPGFFKAGWIAVDEDPVLFRGYIRAERSNGCARSGADVAYG